MKKKVKKGLFVIIAVMALTTIVVAATGKVLYRACVLINAGASSTISNLNGTTDYAWIYMEVNKAYNTSNPKKSRVRAYLKNADGTYTKKGETTYSNITTQTISARIAKVTPGTWKIAQYQYDEEDEPFIGIDANIEYSCSN